LRGRGEDDVVNLFQRQGFVAAEQLASDLPWSTRGPLDEHLVRAFGSLVSEAASPIDDVRSSAAYRRHALGVLAGRSLRWVWKSYVEGLT